MGEEIFREKSLDKVKSPESLDDYIKISNPGVWLLLISIVALLVGACVWCTFGRAYSTVPADVRVENGSAVCVVSEESIKKVTEGMTVRFDDKSAVIESIGAKTSAGYICILKTDDSLTDGFYDGKVVTKSYKPYSFIVN